MNPFEHLGNEHRALTRVLKVLDILADSVAAGAAIDRAELDTVVDYFREVGDMGHHDKEENLLVPALIRHHMDWYDGPLADLRHEHRQERYLMRSLRHAARQSRDWSDEDQRHFVSIARAYSEFLRAHMAKESQQWFVDAARKLSAEEQASLLESFEKYDAEMRALPDYQAIVDRAARLVEKYEGSR